MEDINWDKGRSKWTGDGVTVAVIDSGVDALHPDLENTSIQEYRVSSLENSEEGPLSHGTEVAGVIAAYPKTDEGVLGVAPGVSILSVDVTDSEIIGDEELIEGIEYAAEQGVDVINISIGTPTDSEELHNAVKKAYQAGIVIVAAAGNYMRDDVLYSKYGTTASYNVYTYLNHMYLRGGGRTYKMTTIGNAKVGLTIKNHKVTAKLCSDT